MGLLSFISYRCTYILIIAAIFTGFESKSQGDENLLRAIQEQPENVHDSIYYELFRKNRISDKIIAKHYAHKAYYFSSIYHNTTIQIKSSHALGYLFNKSNSFDSASLFYHKSIRLCKLNEVPDRLIDIYNDLGTLHEKLDVYDSALHYFLLSFSLAKANNSEEDQAIASYNIGHIQSYLENYEEALLYVRQAIEIEARLSITKGFNTNHICLARILNETGQYDEALKHLSKVQENCNGNCDANTLIGLYYQQGYSLLLKGNKKGSRTFFNKALHLARKNDSKKWLANTLYNLSFLPIENGEYKDAEKYLLEAEKIANSINHRRLLRDIYSQLSVLHDKMQKPGDALKYERKYIILKDKIFNNSVANNVKKLELTQQRKDSDAIIHEKDIELWKSRILVILSAVCIILAFTVIFVVYRLLERTREYKAEMQNQVIRMLDERENWKRELFRAKMELIALQNRVSGFLTGPVASLGGLGDVMNKAATMEEMKQVGVMLSNLCRNITTVLHNMSEIIILKNQEVEPTLFEIQDFKEDINNNFKKLKKFLLLTITVKPSVEKTLWTDKAFLDAILRHGISYFDHSNEDPIVEVIFDQFASDGITKITIKHHSTNNRSIPYKNQFNYLTVMIAAGKLNGDISLGEYPDHTLLEIYIPTVYVEAVVKPVDKTSFLE